MVLLGTVAMVLSCIMLYQSLASSPVIGCDGSSSCNQVLSSDWSKIFGLIPVSAIALSAYLVILICVICVNRFEDGAFRELIWCLMILLSAAIIGSALWFTYIQIFILKAFCPYCMSAHAAGCIMAVLILAKARKIKKKWIPFILGMAAAGLMAGIQLISIEDYRYDDGVAVSALPAINLDKTPVIGESNAEKTIILLYDYQCSHCREIHEILPEVASEMKISFALCPTPLSFVCNPFVPLGDVDRFRGSCELSRLAIALYSIDQKAFKQFDKWLFSSEQGSRWSPRSVADAEKTAISLVGEEQLREALSSPWIEDYFRLAFELFGRTSDSERSAIPRMIFDNKWVVPQAKDAQGLKEIISTSFDL